MKLVKYFLSKKPVTILLLVLVLAGGLLAYVKMGKLEDAPFTIKQALVLTPYPGASPSEVQSQVTDVLEESIQALGELYYLKTENRAGLSKITVYVKKETRADRTAEQQPVASYRYPLPTRCRRQPHLARMAYGNYQLPQPYTVADRLK